MAEWTEVRDMLLGIAEVRRELARVKPIVESMIMVAGEKDGSGLFDVIEKITTTKRDDLELMMLLAVISMRITAKNRGLTPAQITELPQAEETS